MLQNLMTQELKNNQTEISENAEKQAENGVNSDFGNFKINKKGFIEVDGEVIETLPSITFLVKLENDHEITARLAGRMRMNRILLLPGDKVKIEMSPYDLTKGRIIYRY